MIYLKVRRPPDHGKLLPRVIQLLVLPHQLLLPKQDHQDGDVFGGL